MKRQLGKATKATKQDVKRVDLQYHHFAHFARAAKKAIGLLNQTKEDEIEAHAALRADKKRMAAMSRHVNEMRHSQQHQQEEVSQMRHEMGWMVHHQHASNQEIAHEADQDEAHEKKTEGAEAEQETRDRQHEKRSEEGELRLARRAEHEKAALQHSRRENVKLVHALDQAHTKLAASNHNERDQETVETDHLRKALHQAKEQAEKEHSKAIAEHKRLKEAYNQIGELKEAADDDKGEGHKVHRLRKQIKTMKHLMVGELAKQRDRREDSQHKVTRLKSQIATMKHLMIKALSHQRHKYHAKLKKKLAKKVAQVARIIAHKGDIPDVAADQQAAKAAGVYNGMIGSTTPSAVIGSTTPSADFASRESSYDADADFDDDMASQEEETAESPSVNPLTQAREDVGRWLSPEASLAPLTDDRQQAQRQQVREVDVQAQHQRQLVREESEVKQAQRVQDSLNPAVTRDYAVPEESELAVPSIPAMPALPAITRAWNHVTKRPFATGVVGDDTLVAKPEHVADVKRWTQQIRNRRLANNKKKAMEHDGSAGDSESTASSIFEWLRMVPATMRI